MYSCAYIYYSNSLAPPTSTTSQCDEQPHSASGNNLWLLFQEIWVPFSGNSACAAVIVLTQLNIATHTIIVHCVSKALWEAAHSLTNRNTVYRRGHLCFLLLANQKFLQLANQKAYEFIIWNHNNYKLSTKVIMNLFWSLPNFSSQCCCLSSNQSQTFPKIEKCHQIYFSFSQFHCRQKHSWV